MLRRSTTFLICFLSLAGNLRAQRLPGIVVPEHYDITLAPDLEAGKFTGEETIRVRLIEETPSITLHAAEIDFQEADITVANKTQQATVTPHPEKEQATLAVPEPLAPGPAEIYVRFTGTLNHQLRGFYLAQTERRRYAATQFEATDARRAFPCFDEPALKATFAVTLVVNQGDTAISNGKILSDTPGPGEGKHTLKFSATPRMSSYLLAMAVGDFQCLEGGADGIPLRVCATPDKKDLGGFALESAEHILHYYDSYYGIKYSFGKLDLVAVPDFAAGAMENTAAIFFRESLLLIDDRRASVRAHKQVASVLAHEMAHLWFGDLVTMKWWNDLWLNEGFATWMAPKPLEAWKPEWRAEVDAVEETARALNGDSYEATHAVRTRADTPEEILELADEITYGKAADVLRMVEAYLGEETFRRGVNTYLQEHAYGNATAEDFWNTLARVSGKPVDQIMASFVDQPGAPVVRVRLKQEAGATRAELSERRFFYNRREPEAGGGELWKVPVCVKGPAPPAGGRAAVTCELLEQKQQTFSLPGKFPWLMINAGARGYYRSSYSPEDLGEISRLAEEQLTPSERLMLVVDGWSMVRSGGLDIGDFLRALQGFREEREPAVMARVTAILRDIGADLAPGNESKPYRAWVRSFLKPAEREVGWSPAPGEADERRSLRETVLYTLGYVGRDAEVLSKSRALAEEYLRDPSSIDPSLANSLVRLAAIEGDAPLYEQYLKHLKGAKTPEDHDRFLYSLAMFSDPALLKRTLDFALSGEVRIQSAPFLIAAVLQNPAGRPATWDYVKTHWAAVAAKVPAFGGGALVASAGDVCDAASRADVESFFATHQVPAAERALRQARESMDQCIDLRLQQESKLAAWLEEQRPPTGQ